MTTRRQLFAISALAAAGAMLTVPTSAQAEDVTLEFVVWNYSLETIQDNVRKFEGQNPEIKVNITDYTWPDYHDTMILRLRGNTQTDVIYGGQDLAAVVGGGGLAGVAGGALSRCREV
jgi:multiple sugar transport system substrate-binding protein